MIKPNAIVFLIDKKPHILLRTTDRDWGKGAIGIDDPDNTFENLQDNQVVSVVVDIFPCENNPEILDHKLKDVDVLTFEPDNGSKSTLRIQDHLSDAEFGKFLTGMLCEMYEGF